ncbi:MAG: DUF4129 domain-containing protein [Acidimicrobiales bacterium]
MEPIDPPPVDPELARATAREILARAEYQPRPESLLRRFLRWLGELLDFRDPTPQPVGPAGPPGRLSPVAMAVLIVLLVLVAYLLYRLVRTLWQDGLPRRRRRHDDDEVEVEADPPPASSAGLDEADRLEAEGRRREAVVARYRATVRRLAGPGWLSTRAGSSSGELRGQLRTNLPDAADPFDGLTGTFEDVWYGGDDPDPGRLAATRVHAAAVVAVADGADAAGVAPRHGKGGPHGADPDGDDPDADELELLADRPDGDPDPGAGAGGSR